jgi:FixJ family two-component response regulator
LTDIPVISIIDDDASVRIATNTLVRSLGYIAHTFASAEEFLQSSDVAKTSCIVTDVQMPDMSGIDLQKYLISQKLNLPIIFITAFPEEKIRTEVMNAGAIGFLSKPFDGPALALCIDTALASHAD